MITAAHETCRHPNGSIDFDFYRRKSTVFRNQIMRQMIFHKTVLFLIAAAASFAAMFIIGLAATIHVAAEEVGPREGFSSFGPEQVIADANRLEWAPLKLEGLPPGAEIAVLRGDLSKGPSELLLRIPAEFTVPNHSHSSDENLRLAQRQLHLYRWRWPRAEFRWPSIHWSAAQCPACATMWQ